VEHDGGFIFSLGGLSGKVLGVDLIQEFAKTLQLPI
jgi:hypothetical protein